MKRNSLGTSALMVAVTALVLAYFGIQAFRYFMDPFSTTLVYHYQVEEELSLSGWVVRLEQVLPDTEGGLLQLQRQEGERVSTGGTVAAVYADQAVLDTQAEITALTTRLEQLEYAREAVAGGAATALKLDAQIEQSILDYRRCVAANQLSRAETEGEQLRALVLKRDYTFSGTEDFETQIETLKSQIKSLKKQAAGSVKQVKAPRSGLYSSVVDGYETVLTPAALATMTPTQLSGIQADEQVASDVGKLILGDEWYYAAILSAAEAEALAERSAELARAGKYLTLRFAKGIERDLAVSVASVGPEENDRVVVAFRGDTYLSLLTLLRHQSVQIVYRTTQGIRVPTEALRMATRTVTEKDGSERQEQLTGVYCLVGKEARFKPVEILHSGEGFALVSPAATGDLLRLRPGDEVIIAAHGLYDGKVME